MFKGLILSDSDHLGQWVSDGLNYPGAETVFEVRKTIEPVQIVDTRNIDFIVLSKDAPLDDGIKKDVSGFVKSLAAANTGTLVLDIDYEKYYIDKSEIMFAEVVGRDCYVNISGHKYRLSRTALCYILDIINDPYVMRCHKSYAINVRNIRGFQKIRRGLWKPILLNSDKPADCLIGRSYYKEVVAKHNEWLECLNKLK